jgi:hypothetical protein
MGKKKSGGANRANIGGKKFMEWAHSNKSNPEEEEIETLQKLHKDAYDDYIKEKDQHGKVHFIETQAR